MAYMYGDQDPQLKRLEQAQALLEEPDDLFRLASLSTKNEMQRNYA